MVELSTAHGRRACAAAGQHFRVFGKLEGVGTAVSLTNTHARGLGVPVSLSAKSDGTAEIRDLVPNQSYVFAVCRFDDVTGEPVGPIGPTSAAVQTVVPLPLPLLWVRCLSRARKSHVTDVASAAAAVIFDKFVDRVSVDDVPGSEGPSRPQFVLRRQDAQLASTPLLRGLVLATHALTESSPVAQQIRERPSTMAAIAAGGAAAINAGDVWNDRGIVLFLPPTYAHC